MGFLEKKHDHHRDHPGFLHRHGWIALAGQLRRHAAVGSAQLRGMGSQGLHGDGTRSWDVLVTLWWFDGGFMVIN